MARKRLTDADVRTLTVALARLYRATPDTFEGGQPVAIEAMDQLRKLFPRVGSTSSAHYWLHQADKAAYGYTYNPRKPPKADLSRVFEALARVRKICQTEARLLAELQRTSV